MWQVVDLAKRMMDAKSSYWFKGETRQIHRGEIH